MKIITANKLNRLWQNGFLPKLGLKIDKTKVLTTVEQVSANTNPENIAGATVAKELINNLTSGLGGNKLIYSESEDAYYIQHGADAVRKKLGSITNVTLVASHKTDASSIANTSYIAAENNECLVCLCGSSPVIVTNGVELLSTGKIYSGGAHSMQLSVIILNKNQSVTVKGWANALVYKLT